MFMFAEKRNDGTFQHVFPSKIQLQMCGCNNPVQVKVTESKSGKYWGWKVEKSISMIYPNFQSLAMCFPYGIDAAEKAGQGYRVQLHIEEV